MLGFVYANRDQYHLVDSFVTYMIIAWPGGRGFFGRVALSLLLLSWISLIILQTLPKCYNCCCNCCQTNCFPVFQETILDVERPLEVIEWPIKEQQNEEEQVEMLTILPNQGEAT